jgi:uncharacterized protein YneR
MVRFRQHHQTLLPTLRHGISWEVAGSEPLLSHKEGSFRTDNHRLMVYSGQSVFQWHSSRLTFPNERLTPEQAKRVGYFVLHNDDWYFVNEALPSLRDVTAKQDIQ